MMRFILSFCIFCDTALFIVTFNRIIVRKGKFLTLPQKESLTFRCVKSLYFFSYANTMYSKSKLLATFTYFKNSEILQKSQ